MNMLKTAVVLIAVTMAITSIPSPASAGTTAECQALRIRIARAEYRRQGLVVRGANGLSALSAQLKSDLAVIDERIDRAQRLVVRATGTRYEQRAINHLNSLEATRGTITKTSTRRQLRLTGRLQKALARMDGRIASFRAQRIALGCPVRRR